MTPVSVRMLLPDDVWGLVNALPPDERDVLAASLSRDGGVDAMAATGFGRTVVYDGRVVACGGLMPMFYWQARAWSLTLPEIPRRCWPTIMREIVSLCRRARLTGFKRIECEVLPGVEEHRRFASKLGFMWEGIRTDATPDGRTMAVMAWRPGMVL